MSRTLDLTGIAQVVLSGATGSGAVTHPGAGAVIALAFAAAGTYQVYWPVVLSGPAGAGDADNFGLYVGGVLAATSANAGAAGSYPQSSTVTVATGGQLLTVQAIAAGTAGVTYGAAVVPGGGTGQVAAGPRVPGEIWTLTGAAVAVAAPSGSQSPVNESACSVYQSPVGPFPLAAGQLLGATSTGSSGDSFGPTSLLYPGQQIIAAWSQADAGQLASLTYWGTRQVP